MKTERSPVSGIIGVILAFFIFVFPWVVGVFDLATHLHVDWR